MPARIRARNLGATRNRVDTASGCDTRRWEPSGTAPSRALVVLDAGRRAPVPGAADLDRAAALDAGDGAAGLGRDAGARGRAGTPGDPEHRCDQGRVPVLR